MIQEPARGGSDERKLDTSAVPVGLVWRSRCVLAWEALTTAFWRPVFFLIFCLALAISGILPALPAWLHAAILATALGGFLFLAWRGFATVSLPGVEAARRRIEQINDLDHRPLETLSDRPSDPTPITLAIWERHRQRVAARLAGLKTGGPAAHLAGQDPYALRIAALFFLVIALGAVGGQARQNLSDALIPGFAGPPQPVALALNAWLAPPDYTGLPPEFITRVSQQQDPTAPLQQMPAQGHAAPVGTKLTVQVTGDTKSATLIAPEGEFPLKPFAEDGLAVDHRIEKSGPVSVIADGRTLASWDFQAIPDLAPDVMLTKDPGPSLQQALTVFYSVSDDYGITGLRLEIERADRPAGSAQNSAYGDAAMKIVTPLPVPEPSRYGKELRVFRDYTAHPWAGGEVRLTLIATDSIGQESRTEPVTLVLPARQFRHPVAQIIADLRRDMNWDPAKNFRNVADALDALAWSHEDYDDDPTVFLALQQGYRRLTPKHRRWVAPTEETVAAVSTLMWKTALYLEDGGLSLALARLRQAQQALMDAIASGAEQSELERLLNELQSAMNDYLSAMAEQMRDQLQNGEEVPRTDQQSNVVSSDDLNKMLDQMREMLRNGMADSAAEMLDQLRQMMENMQAGAQARMSPENQQAMELLKDMRDVMQSQRELMDRTHRRSQYGDSMEPGGRGQKNDGQRSEGKGQGGQRGQSTADAVLQEALRRQLGEIMQQLGELTGKIPDSFGQAGQRMGEAADALNQGDPSSALGPQGEAMDALRQAAEEARSALMERYERQMGMGQQMPGQSGQRSMDPFGRQASETFNGRMQGNVVIPDENGLDKTREIRDELRRRSGQRNRPQRELDYIDKLLDQFQ